MENDEKMKKSLFLIAALFVFLLAGCSEGNQTIGDTPEDALKQIEQENEPRDVKVYGSHEVNDDLVLMIFRGVMNDEDIWVADVHKLDAGQWKVESVIQMNGPFESDFEIQTVEKNVAYDYEFGYINSNASITGDFETFEIEGISDWKIWIKDSN